VVTHTNLNPYYLRVVGHYPEELGLFWNIVDVDNNGVLNYDEFMRALTFPEVFFDRWGCVQVVNAVHS
jgi:hypothetical protein